MKFFPFIPLPVRTGDLHTSWETLFLPAVRKVSEHLFQSLRNRLFFDSQETLRSLFRKFSLPEQAMREIADETGIRTNQKLQKRQQEKPSANFPEADTELTFRRSAGRNGFFCWST